jgi:hypothetical protein
MVIVVGGAVEVVKNIVVVVIDIVEAVGHADEIVKDVVQPKS